MKKGNLPKTLQLNQNPKAPPDQRKHPEMLTNSAQSNVTGETSNAAQK